MRGPQIILTADGGELVVLTRADYDELLVRLANAESDEDEDAEDAEDARLYRERKLEMAAPDCGPLPADLSALVLRSESFLQALRKWRGHTQATVADAAGISQGYLADLENGRRIGRPETYERLAAALNVPFFWLDKREPDRSAIEAAPNSAPG